MTEVSVLDDRFATFIKRTETGAKRITDTDAREVAPKVLRDGHLVVASGAFLFDDFRAIQKTLRTVATFLEQMSTLKAGPFKAAAEVLQGMKTEGAAQRRQMQDTLQQTRLTAAAAEAESKTTVKSFNLMAEMVKTAFGDTVECGVVLGENASNSILVRALLDPMHLRPGAAYVFERYGSRTLAPFTIIGTVARVGWMSDEHIFQSPNAAATETLAGAGVERLAELREHLRAAQHQWVELRRTMMADGDERSVFLTPLAVFRNLPVDSDQA
jgi:hypothetical protein